MTRSEALETVHRLPAVQIDEAEKVIIVMPINPGKASVMGEVRRQRPDSVIGQRRHDAPRRYHCARLDEFPSCLRTFILQAGLAVSCL